MLQPDLFFAFGLSAGLRIAAGKKIKKEDSPFANKYFLSAVLWLSIFYIPQVLYLLFRFPAWEAMFAVRGLSDYPPWFISLYLVATMVMGTLGFYVTDLFLKRGSVPGALAQVGWSMAVATIIVFIGWDGTGYQRLLYTGTGAEWAQGVEYPLTAFFSSSVFYTLLWLEALVLIPYNILFIRWAREARTS